MNWVVSTRRIREILDTLRNLEERATVHAGSIIKMTVFGEGGSIVVSAESDGLGAWNLTFDLESMRAAR